MTDTTQTADAVDSIIDAEIAAPVTETTDKPEEKAEGEDTTPKSYSEDDYKKWQTDLARERRRIGKITAQKYQNKAEADQLRQQIAELQKKIPAPAAPNINQYQDYDKYLTDKTRFEAEQVLAANKTATPPAQEDTQRQVWRSQRDQAIGSTIEQAKQTFPDVMQKLQQNAQVLDALPMHVADAIREADQPVLAIYQLIEDGMIQHLGGMNADTVQTMIERAEDKALSRQKPQTKAPTPMTAARGTAPGSTSPENMTPDQLRKWMAS